MKKKYLVNKKKRSLVKYSFVFIHKYLTYAKVSYHFKKLKIVVFILSTNKEIV